MFEKMPTAKHVKSRLALTAAFPIAAGAAALAAITVFNNGAEPSSQTIQADAHAQATPTAPSLKPALNQPVTETTDPKGHAVIQVAALSKTGPHAATAEQRANSLAAELRTSTLLPFDVSEDSDFYRVTSMEGDCQIVEQFASGTPCAEL